MLPDFSEIKDKEILVIQTRSSISTTKKQKANLVGLGLKGVGSTSKLKCTSDVYGMLIKVSHLVTVK